MATRNLEKAKNKNTPARKKPGASDESAAARTRLEEEAPRRLVEGSASVSMERPTDILRHEHEVIERVLDAQDALCVDIERGAQVPVDVLVDLVAFFTSYADERHHHKEEALLFPALAAAGMPAKVGPIAVMLHEHELGRSLTRRMGAAVETLRGGNADGAVSFAQAARQYASLLRNHIAKENGVLFELAERILDASGKHRLVEAFQSFDARTGSASAPSPRLGDLLGQAAPHAEI